MSLREVLNRHPAVTTSIAGLAIVMVLVIIGVRAFGGRAAGAPASQAYFSTDDGKTWFAEDIEKLPPFMKNGKEAVRAYVFQCGDGQPFVIYLQRYTPEGKKTIEEARARAKATNSAPPDNTFMAAMTTTAGEVKKPNGAGKWVSGAHDPAGYAAVTKLGCPSGNMSELQLVMP